MEIESLRLDFQPYKYQRKTQNISEKNPEKEGKKKKNQNKERRTQIRERREIIWRKLTAHLSSTAWGWRGLDSRPETGHL